MKKKICPYCGEAAKMDDKFCGSCGKPLIETVQAINDENNEKKVGSFNSVLIVGLLCLTALVISYMYFSHIKNNKPQGPDKESVAIMVPDVKGLSEENAFKVLNNLGLGVNGIEYIDSNEIAKGNVVSTNPAANVLVDEGSSVKLYVSNNDEIGEYTENNNTAALFQINIGSRGNNVEVRTQPSTKQGEKIGNIKTDDIYNVYESVERGSHTWYRIGKGKWIVSDGSWAFVDYKCQSNGSFTFLTAQIVNDDHIGVYNNPTENYNARTWLRSVYQGEKVTIYHYFNNGSHTWYKIGVDQWIKDTDGSRVKLLNQ